MEGRNKKSITLDLRTPRGQELFQRLVRGGRRRGGELPARHARGWGLGYEVFSAINPDLILTRASVYGQSGPYRDRPGLDRNGIGFGGLLYLTGYPDRPPVRPGIIISDYLTGVFNALAIMIALYHRDVHRGGGQWVDLALYESVFRILEHTLPAYDRLGVVREREGNRLRNSAPLDNWETADGQFICIVAAGDGLFPRLARAMGREDLLSDPRFATFGQRAANGDAINAIVGDWCRQHTGGRDRAILLAAQVPVSRAFASPTSPPIRTTRRAATSSPSTTRPSARCSMPAVYPRLSATPGRIQRGAPKLGEHNEEIYGGLLGLSADEIAALRADGVI